MAISLHLFSKKRSIFFQSHFIFRKVPVLLSINNNALYCTSFELVMEPDNNRQNVFGFLGISVLVD